MLTNKQAFSQGSGAGIAITNEYPEESRVFLKRRDNSSSSSSLNIPSHHPEVVSVTVPTEVYSNVKPSP